MANMSRLSLWKHKDGGVSLSLGDAHVTIIGLYVP
jgi:hypothetical protein